MRVNYELKIISGEIDDAARQVIAELGEVELIISIKRKTRRSQNRR